MNGIITYLVYRDLKSENRISEYSLHRAEETSEGGKLLMTREQIFPGQFGYPDLYIRHMSFDYKGEAIQIISQTEYELTASKKIEIIRGAIKLLRQNEDAN